MSRHLRAEGRGPGRGGPVPLHNVWREARELIWTYRRRIAIGLLLMLLSRSAGLVLPASTKVLIDTVIRDSRTDILPYLAGAVAIAALIQSATSFALSQVLGVAAQRAITEMRKTVQQHITRLPVRYFDSVKSGELISRVMTDPEGLRNLVGTGLAQLSGSIVTAFLALGILMYLNWQLTCATLLVLAVYGGGMSWAFRVMRPVFRERNKINAEVTGRLGETLGGIRLVKAYTAERRERRVFAQGAHRLFRNVAKAVTGVSAVTAFSILVVGIVAVIMMTLGSRAVISNSMTLGDLIMYVFFTGLLASPVIQMANIGTQITEAFAGLDRIREIRSLATEDEEDRNKPPLGTVAGRVTFEDVWFEYQQDTPVLRGISFDAPPGSVTALVGSSGSGKSTLVSLVLAFNRPQRGSVLVDGRNLESFRLRDYRARVGVVMQDNFLFDGTIAENIRFSKPEAPMAEVLEAARIAHVDEFALRLENGFDTIVGERGVRLSGGQRQRIGIARAVLADPQILILDEATSSLDSESEALIQDGLRRLLVGRTTFVIAHRLSTIRNAHAILVLEQGVIVERGTHGELMEYSGRYRELYEKQYGAQSNRFINPGEELPDTDATPAEATR